MAQADNNQPSDSSSGANPAALAAGVKSGNASGSVDSKGNYVPPGADSTPASLGLTADPNQAGEDQAAKAAAQASGYLDSSGNPTSVPTQTGSYNTTLNQFQKEIDSLNQASAAAKAQITSQYGQKTANDTGSNRAIQARSGELGSTFGAAQEQNIQNTDQEKMNTDTAASDAKYQTQIDGLYNTINTQANADYQNKLKAYQGGADSTLAYLQGKTATAQKNATALGQQAYDSGVDLTDPKNLAQLKDLAGKLGVDPSVLVSAYAAAKTKAETVAAANAAKGNKTLTAGSTEVNAKGDVLATGQPKTINAGRYGTLQYNPKTGQYESLTPAVPTASSGGKVTNVTYGVDKNGNVVQTTTVNGKVTKTVQQKPTAGKTPTPQVVKAMLSDFTVGADNGVSPDEWNSNLQQWLGNGYSLASFKSNFGSMAKNSAANPKGSSIDQFQGI